MANKLDRAATKRAEKKYRLDQSFKSLVNHILSTALTFDLTEDDLLDAGVLSAAMLQGARDRIPKICSVCSDGLPDDAFISEEAEGASRKYVSQD